MKEGQLIERHEVKGTPFMIVETKDNGCFIHMGMYRVSKTFRTVSECRKVIKTKPWDIITSVALAMATDVMLKHEQAEHQLKVTNEKEQVPDQKPSVHKPEQVSSN